MTTILLAVMDAHLLALKNLGTSVLSQELFALNVEMEIKILENYAMMETLSAVMDALTPAKLKTNGSVQTLALHA